MPQADVSKMDLDGLGDVTSYGGVDLKEEEFCLTNEFNAANIYYMSNSDG